MFAKIRKLSLAAVALVMCSLAIPAIRAALADSRTIASPYASGSTTVSSTAVTTLTSASLAMGSLSGGFTRDIIVHAHFQCSSSSVNNVGALVGVSVDTSSSIGSTENFVVYGFATETLAGITDQTDIIHVTGINGGSHTLYCLIELASTPSPAPSCSCEMIALL